MLHTPPRSDWYIMCFFSTYKSYTALLIGLGCFVWAAFLFVWGFGLRFLVGFFGCLWHVLLVELFNPTLTICPQIR